MVTAAMKLKYPHSWKESYDKSRQSTKKQIYHFSNGPYSQGYDFSSSHYRCENWAIKKAEHWSTDVFELWCLEDSWEPLGLKGDKTSHPKRNQPWIFFGRTDAEAEALTLWPPDAKSWFTEEDSDAGKDWRHKGKGVAEMRWDEMAEMRWLDSITDSMDMNLNKCQELVEDRGAWRVTVHGSERFGYDWAIEQQQQQLSNKDSGQRILLLSMRQLWDNKKQLTLFPKDNTYT